VCRVVHAPRVVGGTTASCNVCEGLACRGTGQQEHTTGAAAAAAAAGDVGAGSMVSNQHVRMHEQHRQQLGTQTSHAALFWQITRPSECALSQMALCGEVQQPGTRPQGA
jgi:hypothetical protein